MKVGITAMTTLLWQFSVIHKSVGEVIFCKMCFISGGEVKFSSSIIYSGVQSAIIVNQKSLQV